MIKKGSLKLKSLKIGRSSVGNVKVEGKSICKDEAKRKNDEKQKRLKMYRTKANLKKMNAKINEVRRIEPNIKWFNNTRTISQSKLAIFRDKLEEATHDPFSVIIKRSKIPVELLRGSAGESVPAAFAPQFEKKKQQSENLLRMEHFQDVYGKKKKRKRPKLNVSSLEELANDADRKLTNYEVERDNSLIESRNREVEKKFSKDHLLRIGQSKRIWTELYKVIDSSDIILEVLDARDPIGTRCRRLEENLKKDRPNKHIILIVNKVDLVPTSVAQKWIKILSKEYPTIAYHASISNPFGKNDLFNVIRQYTQFFQDQRKKHIHIGLIGYPNVGKSAIINSLKKKVVCISACLPGQTKYWQFIKLTSKIYLIDCPGIVPYDIEDSDKILRCTMRLEKITNPHFYIDDVFKMVNREHLLRIYKLPADLQFGNTEEFLEILARKMGKLLKGGEPDITSVSKIILNDWIKGKIPYYVDPDAAQSTGAADAAASGEEEELAAEGVGADGLEEEELAADGVAAQE
ncbi:nucleolar GTP-binding protein 2, putative [Plasmodium vivax]|uniref:Nucleolar GTP-binding protein 2 n=6 Tax=Plasmodium vivax TaxID=5855 RepID=A5K107_PLAVS|nr:GTPase, putative [Plasmodium vivax]KMZ78190.1 GTPase [Plasmodium vivax India VII]KMZ83796.1 GTPase [Plasmodium vivax Brazil I]KMZ90633.1 GTPase [Plasmodium vivax Mauritania I]KMZ97320.1 GTPase [Plasmodium vivax North Korean]EDL47004.1 GTPase, putative [Plasmodium vivax]|eukprot:XP_001616731.1 GTPase [Plasmodium vivax Sal-1]